MFVRGNESGLLTPVCPQSFDSIDLQPTGRFNGRFRFGVDRRLLPGIAATVSPVTPAGVVAATPAVLFRSLSTIRRSDQVGKKPPR